MRAEWLATAILSTLLLIVLITTGATTRFDNTIYDLSLRLKHTQVRRDIVIVAVDPPSLQAVGEWPWPRPIIAKLITNIARDAPKALAYHFLFFAPSPFDAQVHDAIAQTRTFLGVMHLEARGGHWGRPLQPVPSIASAAAGIGAGDSQPDQDGIVRRTLLFEGPAEDLTPRMVLQMARLDGRPLNLARAASPNGEMLIPYAAPGAFETVSASEVLNGKIPPGFFRNKFVLLGATAPNLLDDYPTPASGAKGMPAVEVDANVLNSLLDDVGITPISRGENLLVSTGLLWAFLFAVLRLSPHDNLRLAAGASVLTLAGAIFGVVIFGVWAPPAPYLVTMAIVLPYWGWRRLNAASVYLADQLRVLERNVGGAVLAQSRSVAERKGGDLVLQQITLLEETRKRISDLRRFVADILADFPDPVLVVDRTGHILTVNQAASDFADGLAVSTAPGEPIKPVLSKIAPSDADMRPLWPPPDALDMFGSTASARPLTGQGPSGRSYELRYTPTRSADDEPTGWIVHMADITPLVSAMRQREEALQLLSHDMRSPLSAILATLDDPYFDGAPAGLRRRIEGQAGRTLELADAFVRLAKAESADYEFEPIDLAHVLSDAVDAIWPLAQAGDVTIELDLGEFEYVVLADRSLVTRALVNLLDNAVKYSPAGKSVVCRLAPSVLNGRPAVACEIADRAGGMAQSQLDRLFRRFATSRDALNGTAGVGLGLALVHTVVMRHNGTIACESADGEGTVFTITVPLESEPDGGASELSEAALSTAATRG